MRTWRRATMRERCGSCSAEIATGTPLLELHLPAWRLVRCVDCAATRFGEPVPTDLPDKASPESSPTAAPLEGVRYQPSLELDRGRR